MDPKTLRNSCPASSSRTVTTCANEPTLGYNANFPNVATQCTNVMCTAINWLHLIWYGTDSTCSRRTVLRRSLRARVEQRGHVFPLGRDEVDQVVTRVLAHLRGSSSRGDERSGPACAAPRAACARLGFQETPKFAHSLADAGAAAGGVKSESERGCRERVARKPSSATACDARMEVDERVM